MSTKKFTLAITMAAILQSGSGFAIAGTDDATQLGKSLTLWGAEKAGNKDGTIPEYTGTPLKAPAGWDSKVPGQRPDPFGEKPLVTITAQNSAQYADRLTEGMRELFKKYPNYRMDIYPTHRTMVYPKYVLDNTLKNATSCKAVDNELRVEGCYGGVPFPLPKTGNQVMWNHLIRYESVSWGNKSNSWIVPTTGSPVLTGAALTYENTPFFDPNKTTPAVGKDIYFRVRVDSIGPARKVGEKVLVLDAVDSVGVGRRAYQYIPGQRRVKLAPDLSYDTPSPFTGGTSTMDDAAVFLGALDRYDFKLEGRAEKYIPYNTFNLTNNKACPVEKLTSSKNFPNPDCVRWELHRVWKVEATLKSGFRHIYKRRVFYWDEDAFAAGIAENYDAADKLYRVVWAAFYPMWEGGAIGGNTYSLDTQTGIWSTQGGSSDPDTGWFPIPNQNDIFYSPEALAGEGIR